MQNEFRLRVAPSIGELERSPYEAWGIKTYDELNNKEKQLVAFGLYGLPDFYTLWRHQGKKYILWAGSDVIHFTNGYWLDFEGNIKLDPRPLAEWISRNCESWVENRVERVALAELGIESKVCPSFLGKVKDYEITFHYNDRPKVYLSANPGREREYGWAIVEEIADKCDADFYLYGSPNWTSVHHNVFVRGRVPKEVMNEEIKTMQSGLRLNEQMDGFSEITAKSVLWGQYPIVWGHFRYPLLDSFVDKPSLISAINGLKYKKTPNPARDYYIKNLNLYPWAK